MSLYIDHQVDPLAVQPEGRELSVCPRHFVVVKCDSIRLARLWIWKNLNGRFSVQSGFAAFEDPTEATMFAMVGDQFKLDDQF